MGFDSEAEMLRRCLAGDAVAWDQLFSLHYAAAGRFVSGLGAFTQEDVEEICQETFLSVVRNLPSFAGESQFQTWLFRIAANKARDYREKQNAAKRGGGRIPVSLDAEGLGGPSVPDLPGNDAGPSVAMERAEQRELLRRALDTLGVPCREIIELRYFADLSYEEISASLGLNVKTVSSRLSKCLDQLETAARHVFSEGADDVFPSKPSNL